MPIRSTTLLFVCLLTLCATAAPAAGDGSPGRLWQVGAAKIDITPDYPIRLSGYGNRRLESDGVKQHIFAKALAIGSDAEGPAILITVDNVGVPGTMRDEVASRLKAKAGIANERVAVCSSHTHSAPMLRGVLGNLFSTNIPPEHLERIDRYTRELTDYLEKVSLEALKNRQPGRLAWSHGKAQFGRNRRTPGGPVDHDLPVLQVTDEHGAIRALLVSYACHCTTVTGEFNQICGDWAGFAQENLEKDHPGAIVLTAVGCGADQNPFPRPGFDLALAHGLEVATNVNAVLQRPLTPLSGNLECRQRSITLPYDKLPTVAELEIQATNKSPLVHYIARKNFERLRRGEKLPTELPYRVAEWNFGNELTMVFLPGEVVVDYALRLKKEFDPNRFWVNAYANDVPCYIPSKRVLKEGGYEGGGAMVFYDRPAKFADGIEELIVGAVHDIVPQAFVFDPQHAEFPAAKTPWESLAMIKTKTNFVVELVACEPLIESPVAIDFGADGKLWVVEMRDYPMGLDGKWKPGGRIKCLESTKGDGKYDKATIFLDGLVFPTGVKAWGKGVLVCVAPDILYAEDTDGDGKADVVKKVVTGFATHNYQARVNGLSLGLDNWMYGAGGIFGGSNIQVVASGKVVNTSNRDFRLHPDAGDFEPAAGRSQQGRVRNDFGDWFGCDNSNLIFHFPLAEDYLRRNPDFKAPDPSVFLTSDGDPNQLYPASFTLKRFNQPQSANRTTSACGIGIYRDTLLGKEYYGNSYVCEPVHNLVHRLVLSPHGITYDAHRAPDEQQSEFLASTDNWFRPVQVCTGPDGAFWIVDMYRFVIEHPKWITPERLAELDVRAGADKGRIYRIYARGQKLRPIVNLTKLSTPDLAAAIDSPNGIVRDQVQQEIVARGDAIAAERLTLIAQHAKLPTVRLQALCALDGLKTLNLDLIEVALNDADDAVRKEAIRLSESQLRGSQPIPAQLLPIFAKMSSDPDPRIRYQLALSLGENDGAEVAALLGALALAAGPDPYQRAAVLSSASRHSGEILKQVLAAPATTPGRSELIGQLMATAIAPKDHDGFISLIKATTPEPGTPPQNWQVVALAQLFDALTRRSLKLESFGVALATADASGQRLANVFAAARQVAEDESASQPFREASIRLIGREPGPIDDDLKFLATLLSRPASLPLQLSIADSIAVGRHSQTPNLLLADWRRHSPALRVRILDLLLSRESWVATLLAEIEAGRIQPGEIPTAQRGRLMKSKNETLVARAKTLLASGPSSTRAEVVARYQPAISLIGNPTNGAGIFTRNCIVCHNFRGQGNEVGPNLAALTDKSAPYLLVAILDPNAAVEDKYKNYTMDLKDGRSLSGIIAGETATGLTLVKSDGSRENLLRADIVELHASNLSLMPEGFEQALSAQDLADLMAYVQGK